MDSQGKAPASLPIARPWGLASAVFLLVVVLQLLLVARAGTDIPSFEQWDVEGRWLYPLWHSGGFTLRDLLRPQNEHRMAWSYLLDLMLFCVNGQWDPLVQLVAIALLRAGCAAGLAWLLSPGRERRLRLAVGVVVTLAFLPILAWHNVLWGYQSNFYFALGFSLATLCLLGDEKAGGVRIVLGILIGLFGLLSAGAAALVPIPLLGLALLRSHEEKRFGLAFCLRAGPALFLLAVAFALRVRVEEHHELAAGTLKMWLESSSRVLAWPHFGVLLAALPMNLPLILAVATRLARCRRPRGGEDVVLLVAGWSVAVALATGWARGGGPELQAGVPSRYVDFVVLLPVANAWLAVALVPGAGIQRSASARVLAAAWALFVLAGWAGLSAQTLRGIVLPRVRDREAPVRLAVAFQKTDDPAVYAGQPRLLIAHPNPQSVRVVLQDPRMRGLLPPSLQPGQPQGPLSRGARIILGQ